jgi:hypothetical protein
MAKAIIKLAPQNILRDCAFCADVKTIVKNNLEFYTSYPEIETGHTGEDAAEEMFDLTNNPSRQDEREKLYGRGRSVSIGDVVSVDGVDYVCESIGWVKL